MKAEDNTVPVPCSDIHRSGCCVFHGSVTVPCPLKKFYLVFTKELSVGTLRKHKF